MKFKIKAEKDGIVLYGDSESSIKSGLRFLKDVVNAGFINTPIEYTGRVHTDEAYCSKLVANKKENQS